MPGLAKNAAAGRQTQQTRNRLQPSQVLHDTQRKAHSTSESCANIRGASGHPDEDSRKPQHGAVTPLSEQRHTRRFNTSHLDNALTKAESYTNGTHIKHVTPPQAFFAFGWDAHPTRAYYNEICRYFLDNNCPKGEECLRVHPRRNNLSASPAYIVKLPKLTSDAPQTTKATKVVTTDLRSFESPKSVLRQTHSQLQLPAVSDPTAPLRYDVKRGIVPFKPDSGDSGVDGGQASDSSNAMSAGSSPRGSSSSLTSYGIDTFTAGPHPPHYSKARIQQTGDSLKDGVGDPSKDLASAKTPDKKYPPPRSNRFCRRWLINRCFFGPTCQYFHGDVEYSSPVVGIHPPPPTAKICPRWQMNDCTYGYACWYMHPDLEYDKVFSTPYLPYDTPITKQPPRFSETCQLWIRNTCSLGYRCDYVHLDLKYDEPPPKTAPPPRVKLPPVDDSVNDPPVGQRPTPREPDICINWLRDRCNLRYSCKYRHDDLDYDPPNPQPMRDHVPSTSLSNNNVAQEGLSWSLSVHDYAKAKIGPGFAIQELETGFETPWLFLGNIPAKVTVVEVTDILRPFGEVVEVKLPVRVHNPSMLVRVRFSSPAEAREACTSLHGAQAFGSAITARLPVHDASRNNLMFQDTSLRIRWEAPGKTAYCGYSTMEHANAGMKAARQPFHGRYMHASIHVGTPVAGVVTVCLRGIPPDAKKEDMAWFAEPDDVVWARPNYQDLNFATKSIERILKQDAGLLDFTVQPPPYRQGAIVQAWAQFSTSAEAKAASNRLHGRKPLFTGKTRIFAQHVQSLTFSVPPSMYEKLRSDIRALCRGVYNIRRTAMCVIERPAPTATLVRLSGDDIKELGQLKAEVEKILHWETLREGKKIAWDSFFAHPAGRAYLENIEKCTPSISIRTDFARQTIRLLGSSNSRSVVRQQILAKIEERRAQNIRTIPLDGWMLFSFMNNGLLKLQNQTGRENVDLDFAMKCLIVRGGDDVFEVAREVVRTERQAGFHPNYRRNSRLCPVCFNEVTHPVALSCGHTWCRECLCRYLTSSISNKYFPLTCLGNDAKCSEHIPLQMARKLLTVSEFDAVADAAVAAYVQSKPNEFHHCPTPDCLQIYRHAPRETVLQCPSCLVRICPNCHIEAHDGFACPDPEADDSLFGEWKKHHDVKLCPGCKVLIERAEGCNHMTCTQCKTHICWVCLKTFLRGDGIYDHMRAVHGGIGLVGD